ncbi:MAG: N-acetylmuramoyl-L-alanine amidase family protein [Clostridia bacterium]|nr:N-acetylmuramoyl-L-alanine amidase family protein [Clostridia bacterium]
MKKIVLLFYILFMLCMANSAYAEPLTLVYDGQQVEYTGAQYTLVVNNNVLNPPLPPIIFNDRALVPIREVFEALDAEVSYTSETQRIDVKSDNVSVSLNINSNTAYVNGKKMDIPDNIVPKLIGKVGEPAKTMVPLRFISESLGMNVEFDGNLGVISVSSSEVSASKTFSITDVEYKQSGNGTLITVAADSTFGEFSKFMLTDPQRLVIDVNGARLQTAQSTYDVNIGQVYKVRLGEHETSTRIVVDAQKIDNYSVSLSSDKKKLLILIRSDKTSASPTPAPTIAPSKTSEAKKIVVIDAGHGGKDAGALGVYNGITYYEKDINLAIAKKVEKLLKEKGISVIMTRSDDTFLELTERSDIANKNNAAMFVCIHSNSVEGSTEPNGTETYYCETNNNSNYGITSQQLAKNILTAMISHMGTKNRGVKTANHVVTRTSNMPATLIEVGFMSNPDELGKMIDNSFQQAVAEGIAEGIVNSLASIAVPNN